MRFSVTYEIVTPESAEFGDAESRGFISQDVGLRDAITDLLETRTSRCDGVVAIENDTCPGELRPGGWITVINGAEFETGATESRSLHIPRNVSPSSSARIERIVRNV